MIMNYEKYYLFTEFLTSIKTVNGCQFGSKMMEYIDNLWYLTIDKFNTLLGIFD